MAIDIDDLPLYDPLTSRGDVLSGIWINSLATLIQTLQGYLTRGGIFVPRLTDKERDALQNVQPGQLIYNTTVGKFQGYETNAWVNLA